MRNTLYLILLLLCVVGCEGEAVLPTLQPTAVPPVLLTRPPTPFITPSPVTVAQPTTGPPTPLSPTPAGYRLSATAAVPTELVALAQAFSQQQPQRFAWVEAGEADVLLTVGTGRPLAQWLYAVAAPFATVTDDVSLDDLAAAWAGSPAIPLILSDETVMTLAGRFGEPGPMVQRVPAQELAAYLWAGRPSWSILPFHHLTPDLKVLRLDGMSPLDGGFEAGAYPLVVEVGVAGTETAVAEFLALWVGPASNREPDKMARVAMTGVTALARAVAYQMELNGVSYPGTDVAAVLQAADVAHVSHEVAFAPDCPYPNPIGGTTFCSRPHYLPLLQEIGINVVELTGNHVNDWGPDNLLYTINLYEAAGMAYFGGGRDLNDAVQPALFELNGNRIALTGCNPVGPGYAWATDSRAGSRPCDDNFYAQIGQLRDEGYQVIATLQYYEFYHYAPTARQRTDFKALVEAGATAVSGSQGHHAQGFEFHNGAFIHYGLGNLFFDQMDMLGTRQAFVDTYVFYDGRLLSVELWTGLIENWSRPRLMTPAERLQALMAVFQASGW